MQERKSFVEPKSFEPFNTTVRLTDNVYVEVSVEENQVYGSIIDRNTIVNPNDAKDMINESTPGILGNGARKVVKIIESMFGVSPGLHASLTEVRRGLVYDFRWTK